MRRGIFTLALLLSAFLVGAQEIDLTKLDFTSARVSMAGPNQVYIRSIDYEGQSLSVILTYDGQNGADIEGPYVEEKLLQDSDEVAYATIEKSGTYSITISPVIVGGQALVETFEWTPGTTHLTLTQSSPVEMPQTYQDLLIQVGDDKVQIAALNEQLAEATKDAEAARAESANLQAQLATEQAKTAELSQKMEAGPRGTAVEKLYTTVLEGTAGGKPLLGTWKSTETSLVQQDSAPRFAKDAIPVAQSADTETRYEFTAKAKESTWAGYGLHFFVSGEEIGGGYGLGSSYLVWLTRQPGFYQTPATYVQLYQSFTDTRMVQLASVSIPESIGDALSTTVTYDPQTGSITVAVNDTERLSYRIDTPIASGDKIALRTLSGPVEFTDVSVKTR